MSLLARVGIGPKIYAVVALLSVVTVGLSLHLNNAMSVVDGKYSALLDKEMQFALKLERMRGDAANMGRQVNNVLLAQEPAELAPLVKAIAEIQAAIADSNRTLARLAKPEHRAAVTRMTEMMEAVKAILPRIYAEKEKGDHAEAAALYRKEGRPLLVDTFTMAAKLSDEVNADAQKISDRLSAETESAAVQSLVIAAAMLVLGAAASVVIAVFGIRRPIATLNAAMERLARGEATVEIEGRTRGDEVGSMARTVEVFKENLIRTRRMEQEAKEAETRAAAEKRRSMLDLAQRFEDRVGGVVNSVGSAATELQATASQLAAAVEEVSAQCVAVAAASEQASANVQTVASASEEMSTAIHQLSERVTRAAGRSKAAASGAEQAQRELDALSSAIEQVDQIVAAINAVAAQTNLLALNATIEAARAGDAGKGFAVVASEVKNLANQTHAMTEQIGSNLAAVKGASGKTVEAMRSIIGQVGDIDHSTAEMAVSVEQQSAATGEISRNAQQAAVGTSEVSRNVGGIQQAEGETSAATNNVKRAADSLAGQSAMLKQEMDAFLAEIRAA
ncbi:methyl-accepting chemotaxis protein [Azospirillum sp.]|uniref:methyl-accepting chemotaxis protein n=1 Tax=Azospirillum sp. TaxID=34012 RepID=UPI003D760C90